MEDINTDTDTTTTDPVNEISEVSNLQILELEGQYAVKISFEDEEQADKYKIYQKLTTAEEFIFIGETSEKEFIVNDYLENGFKLKTGVDYTFLISRVSQEIESSGQTKEINFSQGIPGDFDRNMRVDGQDLILLAVSYASTEGESGYEDLIDANSDKNIDGQDLLILGANFGVSM